METKFSRLSILSHNLFEDNESRVSRQIEPEFSNKFAFLVIIFCVSLYR